MSTLANPRHEAFAQARFKGLGVMDAYRAAGYEGHTPKSASIISQHPDVKARLKELHNAAGTAVVYERLDAIRDLITIIKGKPSEATADHPLCEHRITRQGACHRFPSKLRALARLVNLLGWDQWQPRKQKVSQRAAELIPSLRRYRFQKLMQEPDDPRQHVEDHQRVSADPDAPLTPQQEAFAQARFRGLSVMQAYGRAGYIGASPQHASRVNRHPAVKARIDQLRKEAGDAVPYKKHEAINDLITIIHASPVEAGPDHPLCETRMGPDGPIHRFPCKLQSIALLARILRWHDLDDNPPTIWESFDYSDDEDLFEASILADAEARQTHPRTE